MREEHLLSVTDPFMQTNEAGTVSINWERNTNGPRGRSLSALTVLAGLMVLTGLTVAWMLTLTYRGQTGSDRDQTGMAVS